VPTRTCQRIIASLQATLELETESRKRRRYVKEERTLRATRAMLAEPDREKWLQDTLTTETELG